MSSGGRAEQYAAEWLKKEFRWKIVARNWNNSRVELDIIALDNDRTVHIVEVKYRKNNMFGGGAVSINKAKQQQLIKGGLWWLKENSLSASQWHIDVLLMSGDLIDPDVEFIPDAVTA